MAEARRDQNHVTTMLAALATDGVTPTQVKITAAHALLVDDDTTGTDHGTTNAIRDQNHVTALMAVSADDGVTPVALYSTASGELLIDSN